MQVTTTTRCVAHTFEVVRQAEVAAVICLGNTHPFRRRCINFRPNPKPLTYLHLWGRMRIVFLHLVPPLDLRLGLGGVPCCLWRCC